MKEGFAEAEGAPAGKRILAMEMERTIGPWSHDCQRRMDSDQMARWVNYLAEWQVIAHLTFAWEASIWSGRRCYEKFMRTHLGRVSYFYALEQNPSRDGFHVHALWADAGTVFRKEAWCAWFTTYGRARIEPVRNYEDVSSYCSKYVTKASAWWDVKLQWHRVQQMHGRPYALASQPGGFAADQAEGRPACNMSTNTDVQVFTCVPSAQQRIDPSGSEGLQASAAVPTTCRPVEWCVDEHGIFQARHPKSECLTPVNVGC